MKNIEGNSTGNTQEVNVEDLKKQIAEEIEGEYHKKLEKKLRSIMNLKQ